MTVFFSLLNVQNNFVQMFVGCIRCINCGALSDTSNVCFRCIQRKRCTTCRRYLPSNCCDDNCRSNCQVCLRCLRRVNL